MASGGAILTIGNDVDNETVGNSVEVDVSISGLTATLHSYRFDVKFSPAVLSAVAADSATIDNAGGTISGIAASNVGLNSGGTLLKLYFHAIGRGSSLMSIPAPSVTLLDSNGNEIPFTTQGGEVIVDIPLPNLGA